MVQSLYILQFFYLYCRSLSSIEPPDINMKLKIETESDMIETGALSQLHLETVYYACQRHEVILENGYRGGFFLGDGAGVGKGRQIAAIIVENYLRGNKKAVWISVSNDLYFDAKRDFRDLGYESMKVYDFKNNKNLEKIKEGVLFLTYMLLISKSYIYTLFTLYYV